MKWVWFGAYIATIFLANLILTTFGVVPVGFGFKGPSAVFVVGFAFIFRDYLHREAGAKWCLVAIAIGAALSAFLDPRFALASAIAFGVSELADLAVFAPLRKRFTWAVVASNIVGIIVDSLLFLWIAFGSFDFLPGQLIGKVYATLLFVIWRVVTRKKRR